MLTQRVSGPLLQMAQLINQYDEARSAITMVAKLVNQPKEEGNGEHGVRSPLQGHVEFAKVRFKYLGAMTPALDNVSFEVPIGHTFGIVGRSGSGKTTVTRLLQRLHSDYEGLIKVDGIDVREYDVSHLRRSLGVVLQENFLFSGTIRENITAAKPHATFDEVVRAARLAGAEEFIDRLPRGYETYIYEGSPNLSGGQRQRLAIARALILDPKILILDEATSALDPDSEAIVNENIRRIASGRTVIVISHRLSSLVNSDAILVLERGKVAAIGRHEECWKAATSIVVYGINRIGMFPRAAPASFRCGEASVASGTVPTAVRQFQSEIDGIRHADEPLSVRATVFTLGGALLACAIILAVARVDRVISSTAAKIVSVDAPLVLQALDPSIVKSIDVREGEVVEQGRQLATLDPTFAAADVNQLQQQIDSLNAQIARDEAELSRTGLVSPHRQIRTCKNTRTAEATVRPARRAILGATGQL